MKKCNLYIVTTEDPLYSVKLIESVVNAFPGKVKGIGFTGGLLTPKRILLSPFIYGFLKYFIFAVTIILRKIYGGKIENFCKSQAISISNFPCVKDGKLLAALKNKKIDLLISINCSQKLHVAEYSYPRLGSINIHNSDLPKYGGLMPILHAIRKGDKKSGITVHYISNQLDRGDIIAKDYVTISATDNLFSVWKRSVDVGANLLVNAVDSVISCNVLRQPNVGEISYYSFPNLSQIWQYRKKLLYNRMFRFIYPQSQHKNNTDQYR